MHYFTKKPIQVEAHQWFKNGDHPGDQFFSDCPTEGKIVRCFLNPEIPGSTLCRHCQNAMRLHGWIDTLEGGHIVCPGDWIITGVNGEHYPCKPDIFERTYDPVPRP